MTAHVYTQRKLEYEAIITTLSVVHCGTAPFLALYPSFIVFSTYEGKKMYFEKCVRGYTFTYTGGFGLGANQKIYI